MFSYNFYALILVVLLGELRYPLPGFRMTALQILDTYYCMSFKFSLPRLST